MAASSSSSRPTYRDLISQDNPQFKRHDVSKPPRGKVFITRYTPSLFLQTTRDTVVIYSTFAKAKYGELAPCHLTDERGRFVSNIFQFSKVFKDVDKQEQKIGNDNFSCRWQHQAEHHLNPDTKLIRQAYWTWREKGMTNIHSVLYPNGFMKSENYIGFLIETIPSDDFVYCVNLQTREPYRMLDTISARKQILCPLYTRLCVKHPKFLELKNLIELGTNIIVVVDQDGPQQSWYSKIPLISPKFTRPEIIQIDCKETIQYFLNDPTHPFNHGYMIAALLHDMTGSWLE